MTRATSMLWQETCACQEFASTISRFLFLCVFVSSCERWDGVTSVSHAQIQLMETTSNCHLN